MREMLREPLDHVASPHGDARVVVAGPAHGDVYRDGWRREEVPAEPQGRFGEIEQLNPNACSQHQHQTGPASQQQTPAFAFVFVLFG